MSFIFFDRKKESKNKIKYLSTYWDLNNVLHDNKEDPKLIDYFVCRNRFVVYSYFVFEFSLGFNINNIFNISDRLYSIILNIKAKQMSYLIKNLNKIPLSKTNVKERSFLQLFNDYKIYNHFLTKGEIEERISNKNYYNVINEDMIGDSYFKSLMESYVNGKNVENKKKKFLFSNETNTYVTLKEDGIVTLNNKNGNPKKDKSGNVIKIEYTDSYTIKKKYYAGNKTDGIIFECVFYTIEITKKKISEIGIPWCLGMFRMIKSDRFFGDHVIMDIISNNQMWEKSYRLYRIYYPENSKDVPRNLGTLLFFMCTIYFYKEGFHKIILEVKNDKSPTSTQTIDRYKKWGFKKIGTKTEISWLDKTKNTTTEINDYFVMQLQLDEEYIKNVCFVSMNTGEMQLGNISHYL